jgi:membrane-associated protease RseP (regulator of RpoE activity)
MSKETRTILIQVILFVATFVTTTLAGAEWTYGKSLYYGDFGWSDFVSGMGFSVPFLLILTVHEFGHYFTAVHHKVKSSLPYYIPIPPMPLSIGTMGALIRLRERVPSKLKNFDIGVAGPLAGFVMALIILVYGFTNLPPAEYIFQIHPEYEQYGLNYADHVYQPNKDIVDVTIGSNLLFLFFEHYVADPTRMPNPHELMHYPLLFAGFLALIFTSLNLLPIGQLDGGHVLYGLVGFKKHRVIASVIFIGFMFFAGLGLPYIHPAMPAEDRLLNIVLYLLFLYFSFTGLMLPKRDTIMYVLLVFALQYLLMTIFPSVRGFSGWLLFGFIIGRFIRIPHPPAEIEEPLDTNRKIIGWLALLIFVLCFSPNPIELTTAP